MELEKQRTATSKTYVLPEGLYETDIATEPVHYSQGGRWQDIDTTIVPGQSGGLGLRNAANAFDLQFASESGRGPLVRVASGAHSLSLEPVGARRVAGAVADTQVTYAGALAGGGADLRYTSLPNGVKEEIVLHQPGQASFGFAVVAGSLSAAVSPNGGLLFSDPTGNPVWYSPKPDAHDAAGATSDVVSYGLSGVAGRYTVTVAVDPAWLDDPARVFPVTIDPAVYPAPGSTLNPSSDVYIKSSGSTYDTGELRTGKNGTDSERTLLEFDLSGLPLGVDPLYAYLRLNLSDGATYSKSYIHPLTRDWDPASVTWTNAATGTAWDSAGGDLDSSYSTWGQAVLDGNGVQYAEDFYITEVVRDWHAGTLANNGLLLRQTDEYRNEVSYHSAESSTTSKRPTLKVYYATWTGIKDYWTYQDFDLGAGHTAKVNVASGNLIINTTPFSLKGYTIPLTVSQTYNSLHIPPAMMEDTPHTPNGLGDGWMLNLESAFVTAYPGPGGPSPEEQTWLMKDGSGTWYFQPRRCVMGSGGCSYPRAQGLGGDVNGSKITYDSGLMTQHGFSTDNIEDPVTGRLTSYLSYIWDRTTANSWSHIRLTWATGTDPLRLTQAAVPGIANRTVTFSYYTSGSYTGRLQTITDISGTPNRTVAYGYTLFGTAPNEVPLLTSFTNALGDQTTYDYEAGQGRWRMKTITTPVTSSPLVSRITRFGYDTKDRITSVFFCETNCGGGGEQGVTSTFSYDDANYQTTFTNATGDATRYTYSAKGGWVKKVRDPLGNVTTVQRGDQYNPTEVNPGSGNLTTFAYEGDDNILLTTRKESASTRASYAYTDPYWPKFPTSARDAQGNTITYTYYPPDQYYYTYGEYGRLRTTAYQGASGGTWTLYFDYTQQGQIASICGPINWTPPCSSWDAPTTTFGYATNGDLTSVSGPEGSVSMTYDAWGRVLTRTDQKSQTTTYQYDKLDRVTRVTFQGGNYIQYTYNKAGELTREDEYINPTTYTTTYTYDFRHRVTQRSLPGNASLQYTYNADGAVTSKTPSTGDATAYTYDAAGRLSMVQTGGAQTVTLRYDVDGNVSQVAFPNGATTYYSYDKGRPERVDQIETVVGSTTVQKLTYDYYKLYVGSKYGTDLRQSVTDKDGNKTTYTYDALNELTLAEQRDSGNNLLNKWTYSVRKYQYDGSTVTGGHAAAVRSSDQWVEGGTSHPSENYTYVRPTGYKDSTGRIQLGKVYSGGMWTDVDRWTHDADGNQTKWEEIAGGWTNRLVETYNTRNQTTSIVATLPGQGTVTDTMTYRGDGQTERTGKGNATYLYDKTCIPPTVEDNGAGTVTTYITTPSGSLLGFKRGTSYYWYLKDAIGSIVGVIDNSGSVVNTYSYDPYGTILTSSEASGAEQPLRFASAYYDSETTLYKMGARYYDPRIGRFLQPDPMGMDPMRPQTWDLYAYAGNDPVNLVDTSGLWSLPCNKKDATAIVVAGVAGVVTAVVPGANVLKAETVTFANVTKSVAALDVGYGVDVYGMATGGSDPFLQGTAFLSAILAPASFFGPYGMAISAAPSGAAVLYGIACSRWGK